MKNEISDTPRKNNMNKTKQVNKTTKLSKEIQENIMKIGQNVASGWGAECYDFELDDKREIAIFHCIEWGERFITEIEYGRLSRYMY